VSSSGRQRPRRGRLPLHFLLVAHHAPDPANQPGSFLPQSRLWRAAVLAAAAAVLGAATLALWATGGLTRADTDPDRAG